MFDVQMSKYQSVHGTFDVVTLCGGLPVMYRGNRYDVYTKVCFSPGFPMEYPIVSVMNIDPSRFKISDFYSVNALPDGTFEIPLNSVKSWQYTMQFNPILSEVHATLGSNFPFFKNNGQAPNYNMPRTYEDRKLSDKKPQHQNTNPQPPVMPQNNFNPNQQSNNQFNQFGGNNFQQQSQLDGNTEKHAKNDLEVLADSLKIDVDSVSDNIRLMLEKDQEIKMRNDILDKQKGEVDAMKRKVESDINGLTAYYDANNSKTLDEHVINDIWHPNSDHGKQCIETLAKIASCEEIYKMFYEMYEDDKLQLSFEDAKKVIDKMAREEFTAKSKLRELL